MNHQAASHPKLFAAQMAMVAVVASLLIRSGLVEEFLVHVQDVPVRETKVADITFYHFLFLHFGGRVKPCFAFTFRFFVLLGDIIDALVDLLVDIVLVWFSRYGNVVYVTEQVYGQLV